MDSVVMYEYERIIIDVNESTVKHTVLSQHRSANQWLKSLTTLVKFSSPNPLITAS